MEKVLSVEEKIRKAEEIYNRRNGNNYYDTYYNKTKERKPARFVNRLIRQIIVCSLIYCIFYVVSNRDYYLSQDFLNKVQEVSSKNAFLNVTYNFVMSYLEKYIDFTKEKDEETNLKEINPNEKKDINDNTEQIKQDNIGGETEDGLANKEKTQEEQDIEYIKNKTNFILPIEGKISSTFGWRNPSTSTVPKYHTGLDIAADTGTIIKSATNGKAVVVSSEGGYGKHYKIQIDDIIIIYAHCSKLYLNEGDEIAQGQEIAEVGSTGNSTGPHLHFEIRREGRLVDPQLILNI